MSSMTKLQFAEELRVRSNVLAQTDYGDLDILIDVALRAYSKRLPEVRVSIDNAVVEGQTLYDYPTGALSIVKVRSSETGKEVLFVVENQGSGDKIKIGNIMSRSYQGLMQQDHYANPLLQESYDLGSYSAFDIEYVMLQDMASIVETGLEALAHHIRYSAWQRREEDAAVQMNPASGDQIAVSLTDASADGSSTTVSFATGKDISKRFSEMASAELEKFNKLTEQAPYGTRG